MDFAGRKIVYIPDIDVKEAARAEAESAVPEACQWLIEREGGVAKVGKLPEGYKDLDEWLLSMPAEERKEAFEGLLREAVAPGEFTLGPLEAEARAEGSTDTDDESGPDSLDDQEGGGDPQAHEEESAEEVEEEAVGHKRSKPPGPTRGKHGKRFSPVAEPAASGEALIGAVCFICLSALSVVVLWSLGSGLLGEGVIEIAAYGGAGAAVGLWGVVGALAHRRRKRTKHLQRHTRGEAK